MSVSVYLRPNLPHPTDSTPPESGLSSSKVVTAPPKFAPNFLAVPPLGPVQVLSPRPFAVPHAPRPGYLAETSLHTCRSLSATSPPPICPPAPSPHVSNASQAPEPSKSAQSRPLPAPPSPTVDPKRTHLHLSGSLPTLPFPPQPPSTHPPRVVCLTLPLLPPRPSTAY